MKCTITRIHRRVLLHGHEASQLVFYKSPTMTTAVSAPQQENVQTFLEDKANKLIGDIADGNTPTVILPASLVLKLAKKESPTTGPRDNQLGPRVKQGQGQQGKGPGPQHSRPEPQQDAWGIDLASRGHLPQSICGTITKPERRANILVDTPRLTVPKPMRMIRFQAAGVCCKKCILLFIR
jgi:hypothetical protein